MSQPFPPEGQYFTVAPPTPARSPLPWLLPLRLAAATTLVLILSFGLSHPTPLPPTSPSDRSPTPKTTGLSVEPSPATEYPISHRYIVPEIGEGSQSMEIAQIHSPGWVVNFRVAPTLNSQIQGVLQNGDLIETSGQQVLQDGVSWQEIRYRNQMGWIASSFIKQWRG